MSKCFELLKKVENDDDFLWMLKKGIIPLSVLTRKTYYEYYLSMLKTHKKTDAIFYTSENYKVSEMTIRRAIEMMER